jgi:murein DD-endopeptidase MepM/ murein hydrolase activator NlpD
MHLYYYRNRWLWFTRPLIADYVSRVFKTFRISRIVRIRKVSRRTQAPFIPDRRVSALLGVALLVVVPNTALHSFAAYASTNVSTQTLTAANFTTVYIRGGIYQPQFIYPVGHASIASPFGWRQAPCAGCSSDHDGVDFHVPEGTPIHAAITGVVIHAGWSNGLGYNIVIDDGYGYVTYYGHMIDGSIPAGVVEGSHVTMGDVIGLVGCTGQCTGAHLHFGLQDDGTFVDPMPVLERYAP